MIKALKKPSTKGKINPREIHKTYIDSREQELVSKGVPVFEPSGLLNINEDFITLPRDITEVHSKDLGEYLNAYTQQKAYLRTLLGRVELLVEDCKRSYHEVSDDLYRKYSLDKISETAKDRMINAHSDVKATYYEYVDSKKKLALVEYSIANVEDIIFMISREVTRRTGDFNEENRNYNVRRK